MSCEEKHNHQLFRLRVFLCFTAGLNTAEIARRMGVTEALVHNTLGRRNGSIELALNFARDRIARNRRKWAREIAA